jgi:hypothetical protein
MAACPRVCRRDRSHLPPPHGRAPPLSTAATGQQPTAARIGHFCQTDNDSGSRSTHRDWEWLVTRPASRCRPGNFLPPPRRDDPTAVDNIRRHDGSTDLSHKPRRAAQRQRVSAATPQHWRHGRYQLVARCAAVRPRRLWANDGAVSGVAQPCGSRPRLVVVASAAWCTRRAP